MLPLLLALARNALLVGFFMLAEARSSREPLPAVKVGAVKGLLLRVRS